ncbi:MAG: PilZ domain-containing protein [Thiotrichales bacterium]
MSESNRRGYYRIDDYVALTVKELSPEEVSQADVIYERRRHQHGLMNDIAAEREKHLPTLQRVREDYPEVADYLDLMERQINTLAFRLVHANNLRTRAPSHTINLSASGMRFTTPRPVHRGNLLEVMLLLFPSYSVVYAYAKVVRAERQASSTAKGAERWLISVQFTHLHEEDREAIARHVHQRQLTDLMARNAGIIA